jgi:hypothetical protein
MLTEARVILPGAQAAAVGLGLLGLSFCWPVVARRARGVPSAATGAGER